MPNFETFAKNIQKEAVLSEIEEQKENLLGYYGNFVSYLPGQHNYQELLREDVLEKPFKKTGKTKKDFKTDIDEAIRESGVDFGEAIKIWEESHKKFGEYKKLIMSQGSNQTLLDNLETRVNELQAQFLDAIKPLYIVLRMKGYQHFYLTV